MGQSNITIERKVLVPGLTPSEQARVDIIFSLPEEKAPHHYHQMREDYLNRMFPGRDPQKPTQEELFEVSKFDWRHIYLPTLEIFHQQTSPSYYNRK